MSIAPVFAMHYASALGGIDCRHSAVLKVYHHGFLSSRLPACARSTSGGTIDILAPDAHMWWLTKYLIAKSNRVVAKSDVVEVRRHTFC